MRIHYLAGAVVGLTCVVADPAELPLDGSTKSGTLSQNEYVAAALRARLGVPRQYVAQQFMS